MRVRESINFKRGIGSKAALGMGIKEYTKTPEGLKSTFNNDLKEYGFFDAEIYTYMGKPDSIEFILSKKSFEDKFDNDKKELVKFLARWLTTNTHYYINSLNMSRYTDNNIFINLDLKNWANYDKK